MTNYYVKPTGSDSNTGLGQGDGEAWLTIQKAADTIVAGDTCYVMDGTYTRSNQQIVYETTSGSSGSPIRYISLNKWGAKLNGNSVSRDGFYFEGDYIDVEGFEIYGMVGDPAMGITIGGNYYNVRDNYIHHIGNTADDPSYGQCALVTDQSTNVVIERNLIHDIGRTAGAVNRDHGIYVVGGSVITIRNNIFYNCKVGWGIQLYPDPISNLKIVNNTFAFENPDRNGHIVIACNLTTVDISNNISYDARSGFLRWTSGSHSEVTVRNNLTFDGTITAEGTPGAGVTFSNNIDNTNPLFTNVGTRDFTLTPASPARDAGVNLSGIVDDDFVEDARPVNTNWDIGAYEYAGSGPTDFKIFRYMIS